MKIIYTILIILLVAVQAKAQDIPGYSESEMDEAYEFINQNYSGGNLYCITMGSETYFYGGSFRYQTLNMDNRERTPRGVLATTPYVDFDTLLTADQKKELIGKFGNLPELALDKERLMAKIISDEDLKKVRERPIEERFGFVRISFPIFQKGKDGDLYAIIADNGSDSMGFSTGGNMHVYRKIEGEGEWEYFCIVSLWL